MKAEFKASSNGASLCSECLDIFKYIISYDGFDMGCEISQRKNQFDLYDLLSHKIVYMVLQCIDGSYEIKAGFLVQEDVEVGISIKFRFDGDGWCPAYKYNEYQILDGSIVFTEKSEAEIYMNYLTYKKQYESL